ncbi:MAG: GAK system CofD-like protein [Acidobacteriota bacterium]
MDRTEETARTRPAGPEAGGSPAAGPRILFFSGGTALGALARVLKIQTHNSIHIITPFDSGGSSGSLRKAFGIPSVGDLRSRLMDLADETIPRLAAIRRLVRHRFSRKAGRNSLELQLQEMCAGRHPLMRALPGEMSNLARTHLRLLAARKPHRFDLRGANLGNLILAGGALRDQGRLRPVVTRLSRLLGALGVVCPVTDQSLHLAARLADGRYLVGQHRLTGKEAPAITSPVRDLHLVDTRAAPERVRPPAGREVLRLIAGADLICYPMGSFYSSLLANLLPAGIGRAIRSATCRKMYIPSTGLDPEQLGMTLGDAVAALVGILKQDAGADSPAHAFLDTVLLDSRSGAYTLPLDSGNLARLGLQIEDLPLVAGRGPDLDPHRLAELLLAAARPPDRLPGTAPAHPHR